MSPYCHPTYTTIIYVVVLEADSSIVLASIGQVLVSLVSKQSDRDSLKSSNEISQYTYVHVCLSAGVNVRSQN